MSSQQHADAIRLWQEICREVGIQAPFATVVIVALEAYLAELREESARLWEVEPPEREQHAKGPR